MKTKHFILTGIASVALLFITILFVSCLTFGAVQDESQRIKEGTYTFEPRPQATQAGVPVNAYLDRVEVRGNSVTFYLNAQPTGSGGMWGAAGGWGNTSHMARIFLQNLDNQARPPLASVNAGTVILADPFNSFENVRGSRFSLTDMSTSPQIIFEEIILDEPDE